MKNSITTFYLRNLLTDLSGRRPAVGIRFRMLGEMWKPNFMQMVRLTDRGAVFIDDSIKEFVFVSDLADVVQFELEDRHNELQPHFHYEVVPNN